MLPVSLTEESQHPVSQRKLADHEARQEAEREYDEHRDAKFEQGIQRHRVEGKGKTHEHQGMDQVDRVDTSG